MGSRTARCRPALQGTQARTRDAIADAAISLFLAHGFDEVSVKRYFPTKEDLVLHRFADHQGEAARIVREREPGVAPVTPLHRHFLAASTGSTPSPASTTIRRWWRFTGWCSTRRAWPDGLPVRCRG